MSEQLDAFDVARGLRRKEEALDDAQSNHGRDLKLCREYLRELYAERKRDYPIGADVAYVSADDARRFIKKNPHLRIVPGPWLGALFKEDGWRATGKRIPSVVASNNGRRRAWPLTGWGEIAR